MKGQLPAHIRGKHCEDLTCTFLKKRGYRLIKRRWRHTLAEIDLVLYHPKNRQHLLVEVKSLRSWDWFLPRWSQRQKKRLFQVANHLAQTKGLEVVVVLAIVDINNQVHLFDEWEC